MGIIIIIETNNGVAVEWVQFSKNSNFINSNTKTLKGKMCSYKNKNM